jgi:hypothetical protein
MEVVTDAAGVEWVPVSSLEMKQSLVEVHRDEATGVLRETHWRINMRTNEKVGLPKCFYYHEGTTTHREWYSRDRAIAEAHKQGWRRLR